VDLINKQNTQISWDSDPTTPPFAGKALEGCFDGSVSVTVAHSGISEFRNAFGM